MSAGGTALPPVDDQKTESRPASEATLHPLSLEKVEKGSHRSIWQLLLELRVLLPYIARLMPLLDRSILKATPDLTELTKGFATMQTSTRDLEVQARNQALQLERIEQQMGRLRVVQENSIEESRKPSLRSAHSAGCFSPCLSCCRSPGGYCRDGGLFGNQVVSQPDIGITSC